MNDSAWEALRLERENLQPTPPVGESVAWYPRNDPNSAVPALIVGIEGPGRLCLKVFPKNGFPQDKPGVCHTSNLMHQKANNQTTFRCGSWEYPRGKAPKEDYNYHIEHLKQREQKLEASEAAIAKAAEKFEAKKAEAKASKRPVEILPVPE